ncbi:hypothetical protein KP509_21G021800 [Ceratopteris richardii]|uniref:IST1-like protein n=1 Tax=Ceratopteris richardii TaxID=49495 RepID=A0A8T2S805_CERRI|nr:hypothetical protein KP509_21G021800 [Ceratopteris richardii]
MVLRNKRDIELKQMRRELAQHLENGRESTACVRVEHIIREQNLMEVYDILENFCELLIVRMPIIESQRDCPLDLKEAVSSLIFAAPRASDLPELQEVQTLLTFKYGRAFATSAIELWPECGVNRLVIEKLSACVPTARVKLELMREIAEQFNVSWDSSETEQEFSNVNEDILDGSSRFVGRIKMLPIPLFVGSSCSQETHPAYSHDDVKHFFPVKTLESTMGTPANDPVDDPNQVPSVESFLQHESGSMPKRFYSPPRESSITMQSELFEETLLHRSLSRTKSEGSMSLQDIIEAAEVAAEAAEKAAQAARDAAELCRSQMSYKSKKGKLEEKISSEGINSKDPSPVTYFESEECHDRKTWGQECEDEREKQEGILHLGQQLDNTRFENVQAHLRSDDYEWTVQGDNASHINPITASVFTGSEANNSLFSWEENDEASFNASHRAHNHQIIDDGEPRFDDSSSPKVLESIQSQPSFEDDPVYNYPNLFSGSSG